MNQTGVHLSVENQVDFILSRSETPIKEKTRTDLIGFFKNLDLVCKMKNADYCCNQFDVPTKTLNDLQLQQEAKIKHIREESQLFPDEEETDDINIKGQFGYTRLMRSVVDNNIDEVKELLRQGADPTICDRSGMTPYEKAKNRKYEKIAGLLKKITIKAAK